MTSPQHPNKSQVDEIFRVMPNIGQAPELPILVTQEQYEAIEKLLLQERIDELRGLQALSERDRQPWFVPFVTLINRIKQLEATKEAL